MIMKIWFRGQMIINLEGGKFHEMIQYNTLLIMLSRASDTDLAHCYFMNVKFSLRYDSSKLNAH